MGPERTFLGKRGMDTQLGVSASCSTGKGSTRAANANINRWIVKVIKGYYFTWYPSRTESALKSPNSTPSLVELSGAKVAARPQVSGTPSVLLQFPRGRSFN